MQRLLMDKHFSCYISTCTFALGYQDISGHTTRHVVLSNTCAHTYVHTFTHTPTINGIIEFFWYKAVAKMNRAL